MFNMKIVIAYFSCGITGSNEPFMWHTFYYQNCLHTHCAVSFLRDCKMSSVMLLLCCSSCYTQLGLNIAIIQIKFQLRKHMICGTNFENSVKDLSY